MPGTVVDFLVQFLALSLVGDFGLYWGHRVQHESKFLWQLHSKHHAIDTPSPFSTLFIDPTDAALQGAIPFAVAALVVRPDPGVLYMYIAARIAENALNHSGIDSPLLDLLTLKTLPFRAPAAFHDAHHKYCNHAHKASNYGESFCLWDWVFGTLCPLSGRAASKMAAAAVADGDAEQKAVKAR
ncbi:fatty acid hydroxylase superfamily-domain-containing protein [Scenedesmus sp. NREL 46B-D3]|nr:fatty acid hydroxylase superfamily-domain-containing protein [Scenedesmus sp. NREL 46B-D3]